MTETGLLNIYYLIASVLFVFGLKGLTHPRTAVRGNLISGVGMLIAVVATLIHKDLVSVTALYAALAIGAAIGAVLAIRVQMTAMPQLVALYNGFGGGASVFVAAIALYATGALAMQESVATAASGLIGAVTFWGSLVAFAKLQELKFIEELRVPFVGNQLVTGLLFAVTLVLGGLVIREPNIYLYVLLCVGASVLGVALVMPIGGADMPVVISLLNSYSGLAACAAGFVIANNVLIIAGALVGASGIILTQIMCKAMNRSLLNVLFGRVGTGDGPGASQEDVYAGRITATTADEVAMLMDGVRRVVFVPGYGLAVAQAQHAVRDLANLLEQKGIEVEYAIHPVAGRMPGHMNVLLAEADIPYDKLREMDDINPTFPQTDVAIVLGANDVVNPVAREATNSPIAGMPILDVDKARTVVVIKRSLSPGFAGIPNPLFAADNTLMYFGDAKQALLDLIVAVKES